MVMLAFPLRIFKYTSVSVEDIHWYNKGAINLSKHVRGRTIRLENEFEADSKAQWNYNFSHKTSSYWFFLLVMVFM